MSELSGFGARAAVTPQQEQADPRQSQNNAGGFTFTLDHWDHLLRFLVLGTSGGTYYASQKAHTKQGVEVVKRCLDLDGERAVNMAVEVSVSGRAIKNDQAIFVLAVAAGHTDAHVRSAALDAMPKVCRTATHLFQFLNLVQEYRGWGRGLRQAVGNWFLDRDADQLAYQMVKYRSREGWTHRDALRKAHPKGIEPSVKALFDFACDRAQIEGNDAMPAMVKAYDLAQKGWDYERIVREFDVNLPWEAMPQMDGAAWKAIIAKGALPIGALIRQLPTLTRAGVFEDKATLQQVLTNLGSQEYLTKGRIHPFAVLVALTTYQSGKSFRGNNEWKPVTAVVDALDKAFYLCFGNVEPMGGNTLIGLDVSGSMGGPPIANTMISPRVGSAAMALVNYAVEAPGSVETIGFTGGGYGRRASGSYSSVVTELNLSNRQRLDDVVDTIIGLPFGMTDCALPMLWAAEQGKNFDTFVIYTDNETWAGNIHPHQALRDYRKNVNPNARLVVVGMTATDFSIADPQDAGMLDVVGFDAAAPNLIGSFARGEL